MKEVLCHPLGPLPWSLVIPEGTLRNTNKAVLAKEMHESVPFAQKLQQPSATIIDGMALVQKCDQKPFVRLLHLVYHQHCEMEVKVILMTWLFMYIMR